MLFTKKTNLLILFFTLIHYNENQALTLHSRLGAGFFAEMNTVLRYIILLSFNESDGKELDIQWTEEFFPYKNHKDENGWTQFFEPIKTIQKVRNVNDSEIIHDQNCLNKWLDYDNFYSFRTSMNKLLNKYIKIKPEILNEISQFYQEKMLNTLCIGVHVRFAAAHASEKPGIVTIEDYFNEVNQLIHNSNSNYTIFLATDSHYVVEQFKKKYKDKVIFTNAIRSQYMEEVHLIFDNPDYWLSHPAEFHKKKPGYKGGKDALMDCLLLSKCDYIIHTTSNVSDFATFFNPDIKSIFLPKNITPKERICTACNSTNKWHLKDF